MTRSRRPAPGSDRAPHPARPRRRSSLWLLGAAGLAVFATLLALGTWQVQRLGWKLDLIARVEERIHAAPAPPLSPAEWPTFDPAAEEYRRVRIEGTFLHARETLVQALTERGSGFWVLTPLVTSEGTTYIVNRGFVPPDRRDPPSRAEGQVAGPVSLTGLVRLSEPNGGFLRANDPEADRWYSRDVGAIAERNDLKNVAPYFVDAEAGQSSGEFPIGGLTVVSFRNHHLVYALTWYTLASMLAGAAFWIVRDERRRRNGVTDSQPGMRSRA